MNYLQTLAWLCEVNGDGKSYHQDTRDFNFNLKEGEVYAVVTPDNPNYYRTVLLKKVGINQILKPLISNPVYGSIPDHIREVSPEQVFRHTRLSTTNMQNLNAFPFTPTGVIQ